MPKPHHILPRLSQQEIDRFWSKVDKSLGQGPNGDCWTTRGRGQRYGGIKIRRKVYSTHRIAYFIATGSDPRELLVCHRCDNGRCCRPQHLFAGTHQDNTEDQKRKGRTLKGDCNPSRLYPEQIQRGAQHHHARLTEEVVRQIRAMGATAAARCFGISVGHSFRIKRGKSWAHVK